MDSLRRRSYRKARLQKIDYPGMRCSIGAEEAPLWSTTGTSQESPRRIEIRCQQLIAKPKGLLDWGNKLAAVEWECGTVRIWYSTNLERDISDFQGFSQPGALDLRRIARAPSRAGNYHGYTRPSSPGVSEPGMASSALPYRLPRRDITS